MSTAKGTRTGGFLRGVSFFSPDTNDDPAAELAQAKDHFFLPRRIRDPFHREDFKTESIVDYDVYDLLVTQTRDALDNLVTARNDYRVLQPSLLTDPNGNRSDAAFDTLGLVVGTAVMGKETENKGDTLAGFNPDLDEATVLTHLENPLVDPHAILQRATTRLVYDLFGYYRTKDQPVPQPAVAYVLARETHDSDLTAGAQTKIQHSFVYSDGFGREIQKKIQAEPGPVVEGGSEIAPRWVGTGWTVFNNKGKAGAPVRAVLHCDPPLRIGRARRCESDPVLRSDRASGRRRSIPTIPGRRSSSIRGTRRPGMSTTRCWSKIQPTIPTSATSSAD